MKITAGFINEQRDLPIGAKEKELIRGAIKYTLAGEMYERSCEVAVAIVTEEKIRALNAKYRNVDSVTDVLSFPDGTADPETGVISLGDVVICAKRAYEQAQDFGHSFERELAYLTSHSVLHLLGYDHVDSEEDDRIMRRKQNEVMEKMGLEVRDGD